VLEELCNSEEELGSFLYGEGLTAVEEVDDSGEEGPAFPGRDGRLVEDSSLLDDGGLVVDLESENERDESGEGEGESEEGRVREMETGDGLADSRTGPRSSSSRFDIEKKSWSSRE